MTTRSNSGRETNNSEDGAKRPTSLRDRSRTCFIARLASLCLVPFWLLFCAFAHAQTGFYVPTSIGTPTPAITEGATGVFELDACQFASAEAEVKLDPPPGERYTIPAGDPQPDSNGVLTVQCEIDPLANDSLSFIAPSIRIAATENDMVDGSQNVRATLSVCDINDITSCSPTGNATITISDNDEAPSPTSNNLRISVSSGNGQVATVGKPLEDFVVKVTNQSGDPVPGETIKWSIVSGDGTLAPTLVNTGSDGLARSRLAPGSEKQVTVKAELESTGDSVTFSLLLDLRTIPGLNSSQISVANVCMNVIGVSESSLNPPQRDLQTQCRVLAEASLAEAYEGIVGLTPNFPSIVRDFNILFGSIQTDNTLARLHQLREGSRNNGASGLTVKFGDQTLSGAAIASLMEQVGAAGGGASADEAGFEKLGFFINGEIRFGDKDETGRVAGFDFDTQGITAGMDYRFMEGLVLGGAIGYANANADIDSSAGNLDASGWSATTYGTYYATDQFYLEGSLTYGWDNYDQDRKISYSALGAPRTANADFGGSRYAILFGGGYDFLSGPGIFDVYGRLRYIKADVDDYREQGARGLDLIIESQEATSFKSILGVQYSHAISTAKAVLLPQAWLEWAHEFEASDDNVDGFFAHDPTRTAFALATDSFDSDSFRLGLGLGAQFAEGRTAFISYEAALGVSNYAEHKFSAGVRLSY